MQSGSSFVRAMVSVASVSAAITLTAGDWPQWRGPNRDGHSSDTGLLHEWPAAGPPLLWKTNGIGAGYSSVAVVNGKIFTLGDGPDSSFVYALDLSGNHVWTAKLGRIGGGNGYPGPRCTPTGEGDHADALSQRGHRARVRGAPGTATRRYHTS